MMIKAVAGGILFGALDFVWIKYVPSPLGGLGNSIAVWAVAGFLLTYFRRWTVPAAVVFLVVAVPAYYLAAALIQHDDFSNMWSTVSLIWMVFAVIAGVVFGGAGIVARRPGRWRLPALAMPAAILFAEVALHHDDALVDIPLAVLVTVLAGATWRERLGALLLAVPLGILGFGLLLVAHFG